MRSGTIHSTIKKLKLMTYTAYKNGWIPTDPFAGFYVRPEYSERRYLSASELQAVMDVRLPNYRTGINRDAFVFCAFTGLSHADVVKLTHTDIHTDDNGERWIIDRRQKTGTQFRVKLLPVAAMLYDRYKDLRLAGDKVFPLKGSYNTLNMSLRHVAKHAGLSFNPTIHMARHTFATTVTLTQGVPLETVCKMLGHKRITTTQIYAKITNDKIGQDMAALSEKLSSVFKVAQYWPTILQLVRFPILLRQWQGNFRCKFSRRQGIYRQRWKYARPCESPEGRALRISIFGVLLVAVGIGDILRLLTILF